eukprot:5301686-Amphidinium_carterae.1
MTAFIATSQLIPLVTSTASYCLAHLRLTSKFGHNWQLEAAPATNVQLARFARSTLVLATSNSTVNASHDCASNEVGHGAPVGWQTSCWKLKCGAIQCELTLRS